MSDLENGTICKVELYDDRLVDPIYKDWDGKYVIVKRKTKAGLYQVKQYIGDLFGTLVSLPKKALLPIDEIPSNECIRLCNECDVIGTFITSVDGETRFSTILPKALLPTTPFGVTVVRHSKDELPKSHLDGDYGQNYEVWLPNGMFCIGNQDKGFGDDGGYNFGIEFLVFIEENMTTTHTVCHKTKDGRYISFVFFNGTKVELNLIFRRTPVNGKYTLIEASIHDITGDGRLFNNKYGGYTTEVVRHPLETIH